LRTSVLSQLAGLIGWPVRWSRWDTGSKHSAWALGPSERPTGASDGGLFAGELEGAGGVNQAQAVIEAGWATSLTGDAGGRMYQNDNFDKTKPRDTQNGQVAKAGDWATCLGAGGGSTSRGGERKGEMLQAGQVRAANWKTSVCADSEQSGSSRRGPSQTSEVREADWFTPQARDWKDTGTTQGNRKSPNLGTQVNLAAGPTPDGSSTKPSMAAASKRPSRRRNTPGSHRASSPAPGPSTPGGGSR